MHARIPIFILGGSDSQPGPVPVGVEGWRVLRGCKGAIELPSGQCLAQELVNRIRGAGRFSEPVIFGPRRIYDTLVDCRIVDVEGNLANTLMAVRDEVCRLPDASQPLALTTCDILPKSDEIQELLESCYDPIQQCCLWGQLVAVEPDQMGASAWKPGYRFRSDDGSERRTMYPGHLLITRPAAVRIRVMNHLLQLAYRHRNLSLLRRPLPMIVRGIGRLILEDLRNLRHGQLPILSTSIPWHFITTFLWFQQGRLSPRDFSRSVMKVSLHRSYHHAAVPAVVFSTTSIRSFAKDIDTEDELAELSESLR